MDAAAPALYRHQRNQHRTEARHANFTHASARNVARVVAQKGQKVFGAGTGRRIEQIANYSCYQCPIIGSRHARAARARTERAG